MYFGAFTLFLSANNTTKKYSHVYIIKHKQDSLIRSSILSSLDIYFALTAIIKKNKKKTKKQN